MLALEKEYFNNKKPCLLLVNKELSLDKNFKGDFNLKEKIVSRNNQNRYIYTGLQIIERSDLSFISKNIFSMNDVWSKFIDQNCLYGLESRQKFYHLNTIEMFEKISSLRSID